MNIIHLENPFHYGQTVEKTSFFDRSKKQATLTQAAVINRWRLGSAATVTKVSKKLEEHGFIERGAGSGIVISDPFFAEWIRRL